MVHIYFEFNFITQGFSVFIYFPFVDIVFMRATADLSEKNIGLRGRKIKGHILTNGQIIFTWSDGTDRKMVLTSNYGQTIKDGYLKLDSDKSWTDPDNWKSKDSGTYSITNFQPRQGTTDGLSPLMRISR